MTEYLIGAVTAAVVNYAVLFRLAKSRQTDAYGQIRISACFGAVTVLLSIVSAFASYLFAQAVLIPLGLEFMEPTVSVLIVIFSGMAVRYLSREIPAGMLSDIGKYWRLLVLNGVLLAVLTQNFSGGASFRESMLSASAAGVLFAVTLVLFTAAAARLDEQALPETVRGMPSLLLIAALISMALMGFHGL